MMGALQIKSRSERETRSGHEPSLQLIWRENIHYLLFKQQQKKQEQTQPTAHNDSN